MIFLLLLLLPSQLGFHFWPDWALVNGIRVDYLSPTLYFTDLIIAVIWAFNHFKIKVPLIAIVLIVLNIFFSLSPLTSIFKWLRILEYYWLFTYLRAQGAGRRAQGLKFSIVWTCFLAWLQFIKQGSAGGLWYFLGERSFNIFTPNIAKVFFGDLILRPYATFSHPNVLGGWLVVVGVFTGGWPMAIALTATIFTFSRTAIFAAIAAVIFIKRNYSLLPLLLLPILIPGSPDSWIGRTELFKSSINIIRNYPLFGTGLGNFVRLTQDYGFQPVHNIPLLALAELGFPLFGYLIILSFNHLLKITRLHSTDAESICGQENYKLKIMLAVIFITAMSDHYWWTNPQMQLLFSLFAAIAVKYPHDKLSDLYRRRSAGKPGS
ncbi:MAG: O-antigen ligase family protein [Patescibacteria group bacterium]